MEHGVSPADVLDQLAKQHPVLVAHGCRLAGEMLAALEAAKR